MKLLTSTEWKCFECGKVVTMKALFVTRDGGGWMEAPPGWLFVLDKDELTHVCSKACVDAIYSKND